MSNFTVKDLPPEGTKEAREVLALIDNYQEKTGYTGGIIHLWPRHWTLLNNALRRSTPEDMATRTLDDWTYKNFFLISHDKPRRNI